VFGPFSAPATPKPRRRPVTKGGQVTSLGDFRSRLAVLRGVLRALISPGKATAFFEELAMGVIWGQNRRNDPAEALAFLECLLIECDSGSGETVLVGGGPASGKTQLQNQVVASARELGILTLTATGAADERDVDGGVIDQLLASPAVPRALTERTN